MRLVCPTAEWLDKYQQMCSDRSLGFQVWPSRTCLLVADGRDLVAGVMVYDTSGPFVFFEHLVTNETATLRQRHRAVEMMAEEMLPMCRHMGKVPQILVRHPGIKRILHRYGLVAHPVEVMTCHYNSLEKHEYEGTQSARPNPQFADPFGDQPHRAVASPAGSGDPKVGPGVPAAVA